jgi:hypothetical protein
MNDITMAHISGRREIGINYQPSGIDDQCREPRRRSSLRRTCLLAVLFAVMLPHWVAEVQAHGTAVDVELIIATDVSNSMDLGELLLQRQGYISAFTNEDMVAAITAGRYHRIAVTIVEWAGLRHQIVVVPWMLVDGVKSAASLAEALDAARHSVGKGTSISAALKFSADLFAANGYSGDRRVIDISGDGVNNIGRPVEDARDTIVKQGITINGLPIVLEDRGDPDLEAYYRDCVIGGPGSFVLTVNALGDFESAIHQKLLREISIVQVRSPQGADSRVSPQANCLIGEQSSRPN